MACILKKCWKCLLCRVSVSHLRHHRIRIVSPFSKCVRHTRHTHGRTRSAQHTHQNDIPKQQFNPINRLIQVRDLQGLSSSYVLRTTANTTTQQMCCFTLVECCANVFLCMQCAPSNAERKDTFHRCGYKNSERICHYFDARARVFIHVFSCITSSTRNSTLSHPHMSEFIKIDD